MLGLIQVEEQVSWRDVDGRAREGFVITISDDGLYAEVRELGQSDSTELPTWHLHPID